MKWLSALVVLGCSSTTPTPSDVPDAAIDVVATDDASADVAPEASTPTCDLGSKTGVDKGSVKTPAGTKVLVRTPTGYDPTIGAPLIIVYAACCIDGATMETFTMLTPPATSDGYVIAYADHISPASVADFTNAANVLPAVSAQYCIDPANVFLTGHSDGGSLDEVLAIEGLVTARAIAPSASGLPASDVASTKCPKTPISVFEQHSANDQLFPLSQGFGADVAAWWAQCGGCGGKGPARSDGCIPYLSCSGDVQVLYCQGAAVHGVWPNRDHAITAFFDQFRGR